MAARSAVTQPEPSTAGAPPEAPGRISPWACQLTLPNAGAPSSRWASACRRSKRAMGSSALRLAPA